MVTIMVTGKLLLLPLVSGAHVHTHPWGFGLVCTRCRYGFAQRRSSTVPQFGALTKHVQYCIPHAC
jgi:hypothetical protein